MKITLKKLPRAPKANAPASVLERYIKKVAAVNAENKKRLELAGQIARLHRQLGAVGKPAPRRNRKKSKK
ncbi:MAG: hypothetical protein KatS3mg031_0197 [Chitinophagales bacterium]|nr:MAG: hypothetical protein KatS3mg031_0197 [Chitinophagales bacterium]